MRLGSRLALNETEQRGNWLCDSRSTAQGQPVFEQSQGTVFIFDDHSNKELQGHRPELDGIRGLAILAVLCSHGVGVTGIFLVRHNSLPDIILAYFMVPLWGAE